MSLRSEVRGNEVVYCEKALGLLRRLEAPHPALAQLGGLRRVFRPVMEVTTWARNDLWQNDFLRRSVAAELVGDDHARLPFRGTQELPEE